MQDVDMRNHCNRVWWVSVLAAMLMGVEGAEVAERHLGGEVKLALKTVRRGEGEALRLGVLDLAVLASEVLEEESFSRSVRGLVGVLGDRDGESAKVARRALDALVVREDLPVWAGQVLGDCLGEALGSRDVGLRTEAVRLLLMGDRGDAGAGEAWLELMDDRRAEVRMGALFVLLDLARGGGGYGASGAVKSRLRQRLRGEDTGWGFDAGLALWVIAQRGGDRVLLSEAEGGLVRGLVGAGGSELGVMLRRLETVLADQPVLAPGRLLEEALQRVVEERSVELGVLAALDLVLLAPSGGEGDFSRALERVLPACMGHPALGVRMAAYGALGRYGAGRLLGLGGEGEFPFAVREVFPNVLELPVSEAQVGGMAAMMVDAGLWQAHGEGMVEVLGVALASADRLVVRGALRPELAALYGRPEAERLRGWVLQDLGRLGEEGMAFCWGAGAGVFEGERLRGALETVLGSEAAWLRQVGGAALLERFRLGGEGMGAWLGWWGRLALDEHPAVAWYGVAGLLLGGGWDVAGYRRRLEGLVEAADPGVRLRLLGILGGSEVPAWGGGVLRVEEGAWLRGLRVRMMRESDEVVEQALERLR